MEGGDSANRARAHTDRFTETVFSWSLEDFFNEKLYLNQVFWVFFFFVLSVHLFSWLGCFSLMLYMINVCVRACFIIIIF